MAAAGTALANRHIVSTILLHLSDMKYKDRRQRGPDQPVELLEFRPTLVPAILVNRLWADEGTSLLWKRYPHLPAFKSMDEDRRQYYANKVERIFAMDPPPGEPDAMAHIDGLDWPNLRALELEVDFGGMYGDNFLGMLGPGVEQLEISGLQSGGREFFTNTLLEWLFGPTRCHNIKSLRFGPGLFDDSDPAHASVLFDWLDPLPHLKNIEVKCSGFIGMDSLFARLSQRPGLEGLEIDLEPGLDLLPLLEGPNALPSPFSSLRRLNIMCYPEIALALPQHLPLAEELHFDLCRIADQPARESDYPIIEHLISQLSACPHLRLLKVGIGALALDFPSFQSFPRLSGDSLILLSQYCPFLDHINLFATEPSAIDGSDISSESFDLFCKSLPHLRSLMLKLQPGTACALSQTALQSLGKHCHELEVLRLRIPYQLTSLPVSSLSSLPQIMVSAPGTPIREQTFDTLSHHSANSGEIPPLFPNLVHLAIARPDTILSTPNDHDHSFADSSTSASIFTFIDPEIEEDLVRTWAHSILTHFPRLEILEAWSDWSGMDNESLNYFLPKEEILASTWEFLSGVEQDLWDDREEDEFEEDESWGTLESRGDWEAASYLNEGYVEEEEMGVEGSYVDYVEEDEGMMTPGRTMDGDAYFEGVDVKTVIGNGHYPVRPAGTAPSQELHALRI